jgi:hypothetical protein
MDEMSDGSMSKTTGPSWIRGRRLSLLAVFGPGIVVMLADTDVGSIITAGQSGVQWGYKLLLVQFILMPILYIVQELTVRLGIFTGRGHGELIRDTFGPIWAWVSAAGLAVATAGALLTEFSGVAGVGELYGISRWMTLPAAALLLLVIVMTGSYRRVERTAIMIGLFELAFFYVAYAAKPDPAIMLSQALSPALTDPSYLYLIAANIGAVIMPWMIFYQQSAIADKKLRPEHLGAARADTAIGAVITQLVMAAVLIAAAATIGAKDPNATLTTVGEMSEALTPRVRTGRPRRRPDRGHRLVAGAGLGARRGVRVSAVARVQAVRGALVLRGLRGLRRRRRVAGRGIARSGFAQRRRAGDERIAVAAGAGDAGRPRGQGIAGGVPAAWLVFASGDRGDGRDLRIRRGRRHRWPVPVGSRLQFNLADMVPVTTPGETPAYCHPELCLFGVSQER